MGWLEANWETVMTGAFMIILLASDINSLVNDVKRDGKVDAKDWRYVPRGIVRMAGSVGGPVVFREAMLQNPTVALGTAVAFVISSVGVASVVEQARELTKAQKGQQIKQLVKSIFGAVAIGGAAGYMELTAAKLDSETWAKTNLALSLVAATRPKEYAAIIEQIRKSL